LRDDRLRQLEEWLVRDCGITLDDLRPASADASFRRYFRAISGGHSYIVMDAPPEHEDCRPFIDITRRLSECAVNVPEIHEQNLQQGFLLLSDLGDEQFLAHLKASMGLNCIRHTQAPARKIQRVAVCGGAGSFLLPHAIRRQADVLVTADFKYHEFFDAEDHLMIADIGHYESEVFTKDLIMELLSQKFVSFAVHLAETNTNPVFYYK